MREIRGESHMDIMSMNFVMLISIIYIGIGAILGLVIYTLILAIKALRIYIKNNS